MIAHGESVAAQKKKKKKKKPVAHGHVRATPWPQGRQTRTVAAPAQWAQHAQCHDALALQKEEGNGSLLACAGCW